MNERQRVQAEPQVHVAFRSGRELRPTSQNHIAEYTTSLMHREFAACYAMLRPQQRDSDRQVARSVAIPLAHYFGVTRTVADAPVRSSRSVARTHRVAI